MNKKTLARLVIAIVAVAMLVMTLLFTFRVASSYHVTKKPGTDSSMATALCKDGIYSYSLSRGGSCSRHGGVEEWIE